MNKFSKTRKTLFVLALLLIMFIIALGACAKEEEKVNPLTADVQIGDEVGFGVFSERPIVWRALDIHDEKVLLIIAHDMGYKNIPNRQYNDFGGKISWEDCSLRKWLNEDFLTSFSEDEQKRIQITDLSDGSGVNDKVFIFSIEEAERYFPDNDSRILYYTAEDGTEKNGSWWLRSPDETYGIPWVAWDGSINKLRLDGLATNATTGVRPAMWVSLDGLETRDRQQQNEVKA